MDLGVGSEQQLDALWVAGYRILNESGGVRDGLARQVAQKMELERAPVVGRASHPHRSRRRSTRRVTSHRAASPSIWAGVWPRPN